MQRRSLGIAVLGVLLYATTSQALFVQGELTNFDERFDRFQSGYDTAPVPNTSEQFIGRGYDWSGVCWDTSFNKRSFVQLSPLHFLGVKHWGGTRELLRYFGQNGQLYTAAQASMVYPIDDAGVGTLTTPLPEAAGIASYPVLHRQYFNRYYNGARASAQFINTDTSTKGSWKNVYGADGFQILGNIQQHPNYCVAITTNQASYTWASTTTDPRAPQKADHATNRVAACWYSGANFTVDIFICDGLPHRFSLYCLDWDDAGREQRVDIIDAQSNEVLDSRTVSSFKDGKYLTWDITNHVKVKVSKLNGVNAVISGMFFDASPVQATRTAVPEHMCYEGMPTIMYGWSARVGNNEVRSGASTRFKYYLPGDAKWTTGWARNEGYDSGSATFLPWNGKLTLIGNHNTTITDNWIANYNVARAINDIMDDHGYCLRFVGTPENSWTGTATDDFSAAANWSLTTAPVAPLTSSGVQWNNGTHIGFDAATASQHTVRLDSNAWIAGATFVQSANTTGFRLSGNGLLTVSRVGLNNFNAATQQLDCNVLLHESQWWTCERGTLQVNGEIDNNGELLVIAGAGTTDLANTLNGAGALAKEESGMLLLRGANTYGGPTHVRKGTLIVANASGSATGSGPVSVNTGANLSGNGLIAGPVTVFGSMAPGLVSGALTIENNVVFKSDSKLLIRVNGGNNNRLTVVGDLTLDNAVDLDLDDTSAFVTGQTYVIASYTGTLSGQFRSVLDLPASWGIDYSHAGEIRLVKPQNAAPVISSQPWATPNPVTLPANATMAVGAGDADDPAAALTYTWSVVSGPGAVTFAPNGNNSAATTTATFTVPGDYLLRVTVSDGVGATSATVEVTANGAIIVDNFDAGYTETGQWFTSAQGGYGLAGYNNSSVRYAYAANSKARWAPALPTSGMYRVSFYKVAHANSSTAVPITVSSLNGPSTQNLNFKTTPSDWVVLGSYPFNAGTGGHVELNSLGNGVARADAVRFEYLGPIEAQPPAQMVLIDNGDAGYVETGTWNTSASGGYGLAGYNNSSVRYSFNNGAKVRWTPTLAAAGRYKVSLYKVAHSNSSNAVPVKVQSADAPSTQNVNYQLTPSGWIVLGTFNFAAGANGYVELTVQGGVARADAVKFEPEP